MLPYHIALVYKGLGEIIFADFNFKPAKKGGWFLATHLFCWLVKIFAVAISSILSASSKSSDYSKPASCTIAEHTARE